METGNVAQIDEQIAAIKNNLEYQKLAMQAHRGIRDDQKYKAFVQQLNTLELNKARLQPKLTSAHRQARRLGIKKNPEIPTPSAEAVKLAIGRSNRTTNSRGGQVRPAISAASGTIQRIAAKKVKRAGTILPATGLRAKNAAFLKPREPISPDIRPGVKRLRIHTQTTSGSIPASVNLPDNLFD